MLDKEGRLLVFSPSELLSKLLTTYEQHRRVATVSYELSIKEHVCVEYEHTLSECEKAVRGCQTSGRDEEACEWYAIKTYISGLLEEMRMWISVGASPHKAWSSLISAQSDAFNASRWLPDFLPAQHLRSHLDDIERIAFPKQYYFSMGAIIDEATAECSICHALGDDCHHIAGKLYNGERANRIIHDIVSVREVSLVDIPANKRCRAYAFGSVDSLTGGAFEGIKC